MGREEPEGGSVSIVLVNLIYLMHSNLCFNCFVPVFCLVGFNVADVGCSFFNAVFKVFEFFCVIV